VVLVEMEAVAAEAATAVKVQGPPWVQEAVEEPEVT
jgi:hypothetical protein